MTEETKTKDKTKILTVRLGPEENEMLETLKGSPYFIKVSEFVRASIRHYYESRVSKSGRVNQDK